MSMAEGAGGGDDKYDGGSPLPPGASMPARASEAILRIPSAMEKQQANSAIDNYQQMAMNRNNSDGSRASGGGGGGGGG